MTGIGRTTDQLTDRQLATVIGALLFVACGWPLLFFRIPPYQDLPDHLATVSVLLHPERYPEFSSNGWIKANSLFVGSIFLLSRQMGIMAAGRLASALVLATTAFALPQFVLAFTDRRRLLVATLVMCPMVHHWWILMGMLNFAFALPVGLWMLVLLARQAGCPSLARALALAGLSVLLWFAHAIVFLLVLLLTSVDVATRSELRRRPMRVCAMLAPLAPVGLLVLTTVIRHASETGPTGPLGRAGEEAYESNWSLAYDLWAHQFFGLSPLSAAGIVSAVALAGFAAARAGAIIPMFSPWALVSLGAIYWFFPLNLPGFGFVSERALPLMWAWALVRVPARVPRWLGALLAAASFAWAIGLAADLFRASHDLDDFTAAAPALPEGSRLLTLNFEPRVSARNTWSLLHASGMYTLLRQATPQDVWADSPSMPIRRARPPAFVEDPVAVREFLYVANTPQAYCAAMVKAKLPDAQCQSQWSEAWAGFWNEARDRYDHVLLWGASPDVISTMPAAYVPRFVRGRLELFARRGPI